MFDFAPIMHEAKHTYNEPQNDAYICIVSILHVMHIQVAAQSDIPDEQFRTESSVWTFDIRL
jgi:hypothetical protein